MNRFIIIRLLVLILMFSSCEDPVNLDKEKLDTAYFVGEYKTNYLGQEERIYLKKDGFYDYVNKGLQDTVIKNAGKWKLIKSEKYNPSIYFENYPNIRSNKVFSEEVDRVIMTLDVKIGGQHMGDLVTMVIDERGGELYYTFIKENKKKNKDYLLKTE